MRGKLLQFQQMLTTRKCGSPTLVAEHGNPNFGQCGRRVDEEKKRHSLGPRRRKSTSNIQLHVDRQLLDHITLERKFGTDATRSC